MKRTAVIWLSIVLLNMAIVNASFFPYIGGSEPLDSVMAPASPIRINGNAGFSAHAASGNGGISSPWVIENLEIDGAGFGYCLYIGNTTEYFTVRQCAFSNASGGTGTVFASNSGITLFNVVNGNITNNTVNQNQGSGIYLNESGLCVFTWNDIILNNYGMRIDNTSEANTIYNNNFLGNAVQAFDDSSNIWNLTEPSGGNFWSDWTAPDNDFDGFIDNPYYIPGSGDEENIPPGYYETATGKTGTVLKTALHNIIRGHTEYSYTEAEEILKDTDEDPNNPDNVILLYTGWSSPKTNFGGGVSNWNREHVWAKSHGFPNEGDTAYSDVHHLRPTDVTVNSARGSLDFDNGGSQYIDGDGTTFCYSDSDSWEAWNEVKGDVARIMFYMVVRYEGTDTSYDLELQDFVGTSGPYFGKLSTLLQWHENDPVSDWERTRNDKIYYNWQHNRNPFIDHPEYVDLIWGSGNGTATGGGGGTGKDYLPFTYRDGWDSPPGPVHNIDRGTDHHTIQRALDNATSGDRIVVDDGIYFENVIIGVPVTLSAIDGNAIIDGGSLGTAIEIQASNVELSGFKVQNGGTQTGDAGIRLSNADFCHLHHNNVSSAYNGIIIGTGCDNNAVDNNTISYTEMGVLAQGSGNTIVHNNFLANTDHATDSGLNAWDKGYPVGGNHYDNWTVPDSNADGFVDYPFIIPTGGGGGTALDLEGYRIEQYGGSETWTFSAGTSVPPQGYVVIARLADRASFESFWGVTFGPDVLYIDADNSAGSDFLVINGGETFELFDDASASLDGPTGYTMVSGNSAQRTATTDDGTLSGSWDVVPSASATPGSGAFGDTSSGLVINEYSDASSYAYEFVELYYDSPTAGGAGSNNLDDWPFAELNGWIESPVQSFPISLEAGWNLVSLPLAQDNTTVESVLGSISGKYDIVRYYDPLYPEYPWKSYHTFASPMFNDISDITREMGIWIHATQACELTLTGVLSDSTNITLKAGWNLVGYPSLTPTLAMAALAGTDADMIAVFTETSPYVEDIYDLSSVLMEPGRGYWVHVPGDAEWTVDW